MSKPTRYMVRLSFGRRFTGVFVKATSLETACAQALADNPEYTAARAWVAK